MRRLSAVKAIGRRAVVLTIAVSMIALEVGATSVAQANTPPFFCGSGVTLTQTQIDSFASRWADRILGKDPNFSLQQWIDDAVAGKPVPSPINTEVGFTAATSDTPDRGCLTASLAATLKTRDATFGMDESVNPPVPLPSESVDAMLGMILFHNGAPTKPNTPTPGPKVDIPDPVAQTLHNLGLDTLPKIQVPEVAAPAIPSPISKLIADLVKGVQGLGLPNLPSLTGLLQLPAISLKLPNLLQLPSITDVINLVRSIIDATTYTVCWKGPKTNGKTTCQNQVIGLPLLIDVQGDSAPDLVAQLAPTVVPAFPTGLSMAFTLDRIASDPVQAPPPVQADVTAAWDLPAANARVDVGFLSTFKPNITLARHSALTATVKNLSDATNGNPSIPFTITEQQPSTDTQVLAGYSKLIRNASSGAVTVPDSSTATMDFSPVPQTTTGELDIQTTTAGANKARYVATLKPSIQTTAVFNLVRSYSVAPPATCCPVQSVTVLADKLSTSTSLDITKDSQANAWTVHYTGSSAIGHLNIQGADYPTASDFNALPAAQTVTSFDADATQIPTKVDVVATLPVDGANPRTVDVNYTGADKTNPNTLVVIPTVDVSTLAKVNGDVQRSFTGHAEQVPGHVHVLATLAGDALASPPGPNLDVNMTYDSSSAAHNLVADFFDKSSGSTTKLHGTVATLPPWMNVIVGNHPTSHAVTFDARTSATAPAGSAALGTAQLQYATNADYLALGPATPTTDQYAVVKTGFGADGKKGTSDDTSAIQASYTGLKYAAVSLADDGQPNGNLDLAANVQNDQQHSLTARFDDPSAALDALVQSVPKSVNLAYSRRQTGTTDACGQPENTHKVIYDASDTIDHASVTVSGKTAVGLPDPNDQTIVSAGRDPQTNVGPIPTHMEVFANSHTKAVNYRGSSSVGQVAASMLDASPSCGSRSGLNADLRGVPTSFGAIIDPQNLAFADLANGTDPIDQVSIDPTKAVSPALGSIALAFTDQPAGVVPTLPTTSELSVTSDKRPGGATTASVRIPGVQRFGLALTHDPSDATTVTQVNAGLQLASAVADVGTNLDFVGDDGNEARVTGSIGRLTPQINLVLGLVKDHTSMHYDTPGDHLNANLEIGLGAAGQLDTVDLGTNRPVGLIMRDSATAKKIGVLMDGAPSTFDLHLDQMSEQFRGTSETPFLSFQDYEPPAGQDDLGVDVVLANQPDPKSNITINAALHASFNGYSMTMEPIATGIDTTSGPDSPSYFDLLIKGNKPLDHAGITVGAGVPDASSAMCSACKIQLTGTLSNLPPGFEFHLESNPSTAHPGQKDSTIELTQLGADGNPDLTQTIDEVQLDVLFWEIDPDSGHLMTVPQIQADLQKVPSHVTVTITGNGKQDDSKVKPCTAPSNSLPTLTYTAEGANADHLQANLNLNFAFTADDKAHPDPDPPGLEVGATDLSHSVTFTNSGDGKYIVTTATPITHLHVEVNRQTLQILNLSLDPGTGNCGFSETVFGVTFHSTGGLAFNLRTGIVLDVTNLSSLTLEPGIFVHVKGTFGTATFQLRNPQLVDVEVASPGISAKVHITDSIQPDLPIIPSIGVNAGPLPIPVDVDFIDLTVNQTADWINVSLLVPCDVSVSWDGVDITAYHLHVTTSPGLAATTTDGFTTTDHAVFLILPDLGQWLGQAFEIWLNPLVVLIDRIVNDEGSLGAHIGCP